VFCFYQHFICRNCGDRCVCDDVTALYNCNVIAVWFACDCLLNILFFHLGVTDKLDRSCEK
jgi:hypothetical protein